MTDNPPSGWYPDPHDPTLQRYWNGFEWTDHTAEGVPATRTQKLSAAPTTGTRADWPSTATTAGGVNTWTWQSFVVTLLCGGTFISMIGIYNAGKAQGSLNAGDVARAHEYARRARNWTLGGLAFGVVSVLLLALTVGALVRAGAQLGECAGVTPSDGAQYAVCRTLCEQDPTAPECLLFAP